MKSIKKLTPESASPTAENSLKTLLPKIRGGFFLVIGYLLSPLSWWNDLVFNLPIAYAFGYVCSLFAPQLLMPCVIIGYWLSNIIGILLMQAGAIDVLQKKSQERNVKKELLTGLVSSTIYTFLILALIQFHIIETPNLFSGN
jgi:large-conductance mechanosensitive channel